MITESFEFSFGFLVNIWVFFFIFICCVPSIYYISEQKCLLSEITLCIVRGDKVNRLIIWYSRRSSLSYCCLSYFKEQKKEYSPHSELDCTILIFKGRLDKPLSSFCHRQSMNAIDCDFNNKTWSVCHND